jgi:hypothetical protein
MLVPVLHRIRVDRPTIVRLAAESCRDPKTVESVLRGKGNDQSRAAVTDAARRLGLTITVPAKGE